MDELSPGASRRQLKDVGGTAGGLGEFIVGIALLGAGAWLFLSRVVVTSGFGSLFGLGSSSFGTMLVPLFLGVMLLFWNGRSILGWLLALFGALGIFAGIISDLHVFFQPTSLPTTLTMLGMMAAGLGLVARALRPHGG